MLGIPITLGSYIGLVLTLVVGLPAIIYRIKVEERSLKEWFGDAYINYMKKSARLIPYFW